VSVCVAQDPALLATSTPARVRGGAAVRAPWPPPPASMSLLERQLDALLEPLPSSDDVDPETEREVDRQRVGEALRVLGRGCPERASGTATKPQISTEMWARCAEACVRVGSIKDASDCLRSFFTAQPPTNQFLARAYLCQASVEHERIRQGKLRGDEAAAQCLHAISFVVRGLEVATSDVGAGLGAPDPKLYSFLVVNASTVWWKVSRPLRVHVLMAKLVPSLERLLQALANADKSMEAKDPAWMAQLYICMGQCQMDAGDAAKAGQVATDALKLADSAGLVDHMERAYRLQIHAGQKSVAPPKPFLKVAGLLQEVASGITAPVSVSGVLMEALKDSHADPVLAGALAANPDDSKQALVVANEEDEKLKAKPSQECLDLVAEIGCAAIHTGLPSVCAIAEACVLRASLAKSLRSRVLCQYVSAGLAIHGLGDESERYTRRMVAVRLDVLSQLERALQSAERLPDKDLALVQEGCVLVWNVALPLLQPNLRVQPMVQRALFRACKVLDDRDSYLHELRATLQLELARAAIDDDFVSRAQSCVDKALELNYIDQDQEQTGRDRPMDDRLLPLKQALSLKTDIYNDPTTDGERVSLLLENSLDSKGLQAAEAKKSFLTRAANLLNQIDTPAEDAEYFRLWVDLTKQAWAGKLIDLAEMGCEKVLPSSWDPVRARERVIWSVQLYFIRGEVAVMRLREAGLELAASGGAESEQNRLVATANNSFLAASKLGLDLQESWIVVNAVTYTYNYYLPLLRQRRYAEVKEQLTWCFDDLKAINVDEPVLLCAVADALACALEHTFLLDNRPGGGDAPEGAELPTYDALQKLDITSANAEELTMATDVCEFVCQDHEERRAKPTAAQQRDLIATMRRVQKWRAANPTPLPSNHAQVFMLLNTCTEKLASGKQHEAAADVQEAFSIMRDENTEHSTELWSRLAFAALDSGLYSDAVQCAEKCESAIPTGALGVAGQAYGKNPNNWVNWRWFSVAESTHGQALMKMLDIKRQDKSDLDKIKQSAMEHFTLAAQYGALARYAPLVEAPARHFWNASLDFQKNEVTRKVLNDQRKMLRKILDAMQDCTGPIATKVKVRMYEALLTCYRDAQNWKEGLTLTDEAFKNVPATNHKSLWDERVIFMTKMGMNLLGAMLKVKEMYSERMLARVWVSVARVATNRVEQFQAYTSAIGALHKTPWEAVDYSIEFAEWLFCNDFPIADAEDQLLSVCDYLLGIASPEGDGTIQTSRSGDSLGSRSMKSGMGATNTARSTAASTAASIAQSQVSKGAPRPKSLDVGHYEIMMRVYVMLASITVNRDKQTEYCMLAAEQVVNIWQHLSEYTSEAETDGAGVPQHAAGWTTFSISDELRTCISSAAAGTAPNRTTLPRPELTWDYCVKLVTMLNERGYAVQSLPVLGLLEVLSADVLVCRQGKLLQAWVHLRTGSILESLELSQAARDRQQRASNVSVRSTPYRTAWSYLI
jgi:tetratricopeptide (TPR) repeat protein